MENNLSQCQNRLETEALVKNLPEVALFVVKEAKRLKLSQMELSHMLIVTEELFVNIASYAYAPATGMVTIVTNVDSEENSMSITFIDRGIPYNPLEKPDPDITLDASKRKQGGLGIFFVKKKVDTMTYAFEDGQNIVTVKKTFKEDPNARKK